MQTDSLEKGFSHVYFQVWDVLNNKVSHSLGEEHVGVELSTVCDGGSAVGANAALGAVTCRLGYCDAAQQRKNHSDLHGELHQIWNKQPTVSNYQQEFCPHKQYQYQQQTTGISRVKFECYIKSYIYLDVSYS